MKMRSPIRWFGGKGNFTQHLLPLIPEHHCYVEVFGGGASLLFAKPPSKVEVYNDIDGDVVAFFRLFHDDDAMEEFKRKCYYTPYSREWFHECNDTWREHEGIERVYRWFVVNRMLYGSITGSATPTFTGTRQRSQWFQDTVRDLDNVVERLHYVQVENDTWERIVNRYDASDTLFYLDPPYIPVTRKSLDMYKHEMAIHHHQELVECLRKVKGKVLLSGYPHPLYDSLSWACNYVDTSLPNGNASHKRTECLWRNYEIQPTLF